MLKLSAHEFCEVSNGSFIRGYSSIYIPLPLLITVLLSDMQQAVGAGDLGLEEW